MHIRRVATGHDQAGKSRFVSDENLEIKGIDHVFDIALLWAGDQPPSFPSSRRPDPCPDYFPSKGGYRFSVVTVPPRDQVVAAQAALTPGAMSAAMTEIEGRVGSGLFEAIERDDPGMHTTDTVDMGVVIKGVVTLELDDGEMVRMGPGDTFVQNGTRHRWANHGDETVLMAVVLVGGNARAAKA